MRENVASFFGNQLDFIFFFYGLAFILLGVTCSAVARSKGRGEAWPVLAWFGFTHGGGGWLDLAALISEDTPAFAALRAALMTGSFVLLLEFARLEGIRLGLRLPRRWIYVPLVLLVVLAGVAGGVTVANVVARYAIGLVGAMATSLVFARNAKTFSGDARRYAIFAALGFALYGVAAGAIVPIAPFWPASAINYNWFANLTGTPIQLVRGLLACWIAFSIWAIWTQLLSLEVSSARYTAYLRQQFMWTLIAMAAILLGGWTLTEFLGGLYRANVQEEARGDIDMLASRLAGETAIIDGMVKTLAGSPSVLPVLIGGSRQDDERAKSVLNLHVEASGAKRGVILNRSGAVVASSTREEARSNNPNYSSSSFFQISIGGEADHRFEFDAASGARDYYASHPIYTEDGKIVGVAVLTKSLDAFEADLTQFNRSYFLINSDGVVVLTNRPAMMFRTLWPLSADKQSALARQFGALKNRPVLEREIPDGTWTTADGERNYVYRRLVNHSQWSLVILLPTREVFASRVLGIRISLLATIMTLIYLLGKERRVHDTVQMDNRLKLQELARDLSFKATTDPLTGLHNRLKFDQALASEILRAERYKTPLSVIFYDVDHFKRINDTYGHQTGDRVLIQLSRFVQNFVRSTDLLARWGGEEFVILLPGSDAPMAVPAAEKLRDAIGQVVFEEAGSVTCSFGVAQYLAGETLAAFISRADNALYRAKVNGRNRVELGSQPAGGKPEPALGE